MQALADQFDGLQAFCSRMSLAYPPTAPHFPTRLTDDGIEAQQLALGERHGR